MTRDLERLGQLLLETREFHESLLKESRMEGIGRFLREFRKSGRRSTVVSHILSDERVDSMIRGYKKGIQVGMSPMIVTDAWTTRDKDKILSVSKTLSDRRVVENLNSVEYNPESCGSWAAIMARKWKDPVYMVEITSLMKKYGDAIGKSKPAPPRFSYDPLEIILNKITFYEPEDRDGRSDLINVLQDEDVVNSVVNYGDDAATEMVTSYVDFGRDFVKALGKRLMSDDILGFIRQYEGDKGRVAPLLVRAAGQEILTGGENPVSRTLSMIRRLEGKAEREGDLYVSLQAVSDWSQDDLRDEDDMRNFMVYYTCLKRIPKPSQENKERYDDVIFDAVRDLYGIKKDISHRDLVTLLEIKEEDVLRSVVDRLNKSKDENVRFYSLSAGELETKNYSMDDLVKNSVISIVGSRNKGVLEDAERMVSDIVGMPAVNRARSRFQSDFRRMAPDIFRMVSSGDYKGAFNKLVETENEQITDVLRAAKYQNLAVTSPNLVVAAESKNPLDYNDSVQNCCAYLPHGGRHRDGIMKYCEDDRFVLVKYMLGDIVSGSAICYLENGNFLVDSVEGHPSFSKKGIFDIVLDDLRYRARVRGADYVIFNLDPENKTPMSFLNNFVGKRYETGIICSPESELPKKNPGHMAVFMKLDTEAYMETKLERGAIIVPSKDPQKPLYTLPS